MTKLKVWLNDLETRLPEAHSRLPQVAMIPLSRNRLLLIEELCSYKSLAQVESKYLLNPYYAKPRNVIPS